jgi:hypothetical protein
MARRRSKPVAEVVETAVEQTRQEPTASVAEDPAPKPERPTPRPPEAPDIFDSMIAARQAEALARAETHTPPTTASERPVRARGDDHAGQPKSHAENVGRRGPRYNEQGITDSIAGAKLLEHHDPYLSIIRFEEKPSANVLEKLREASFQWNTQNKEWTRPIRFDTRQQDRINADEVFNEVCKIIRTEKGVTHSFGGA